MKKVFTMTALLVAASSYAQTIGGTINYDVSRSSGSTSMGLADTTLSVSASEKIGSTTVTANLALDGAARDKTLSGRDAFIKFDSVVGAVTVGRVELANSLAANSFGLIPGIGSDGVVVGGPANANLVRYETPAIGPFAFSVSDVQSTLGGSHIQVYGAGTKLGKLAASVDYTAQTNRVRTSAQYDFGFAKVGAGWSGRETGVANSYVVAVAVPVAQSVTVGGAFYNGNGKAYEVAASYALSKNTSVALAYRDVNANSVAANNVGTTRVRVQYKF